MKKRPLSEVLEDEVKPLLGSMTAIAKAAGLKPKSFIADVNAGKYSDTSINRLNKGLEAEGIDLVITPELFQYGRRRARIDSAHATSAKGLLHGLKALDKVKPAQREARLKAAFASITPDCNAFLAVVTHGTLPRLFERTPKFDALRDTMFAAHAYSGMMAVFITPDEATLRELREDYTDVLIPGVENFINGFNFYREAYCNWCECRGLADAAQLVDDRMGFIQHNRFTIAGLGYVVSYAGVNPKHTGMVEGQIIEWGPANATFGIVLANTDADWTMRRYISKTLQNAAGQIKGSFHANLTERIKVRS